MSNIFDRLTESYDANEQTTSEVSQNTENGRIGEEKAEGSRIPFEVRSTVQELLRQGYLEEHRKPEVFRRVIVYESQIDEVLDPLDLWLKIDSHRGVALVMVREDEDRQADPDQEWSHPLVRRQRMTLEQSLLIAILRGIFVLHEQESGVGERPATIAIDELLPQYLTYVQDSGSDSRNEQKLRSLLEQLKGYGIVTEVDANDECVIRPLIAHLADPASLRALLDQFKTIADAGNNSRDAEAQVDNE